MWVSKSRVLEVKAAQLRPRAQSDFCADSRTHYQTQLNGSRHCIDVTAEGFCISSPLSACFQKLNTHKVLGTGINVKNMTPDNIYKDYIGERVRRLVDLAVPSATGEAPAQEAGFTPKPRIFWSHEGRGG